MSITKEIPEGWKPGCPHKSQTGNYKINGFTKTFFWDGRTWHRATKNLFGEMVWHEPLNNQPDVKYHKLVKLLYVSTESIESI